MAERPGRKNQRRKSLSIFLGSGSCSGTSASNNHNSASARKPHATAGHDRSSSDGYYGARYHEGSQLRRERPKLQKHGRPSSSASLLIMGNNPADHGPIGLYRTNSEAQNRIPASQLSHDPSRPHSRSRSYPKSMRKSVFGSLRSLGSLDDDQQSTKARSKGSSIDDEDLPPGMGSFRHVMSGQVLHYGEVQTTTSMWRKKSQYLVLTDTHLVRFKNQSKAAEVFSSVPASFGRNSGASMASHRMSMASIASFPDPQMGQYGDVASGIPLNNIVAVYKIDDGRPYFSIEVCYVDEKSKPLSLHLQLNDPQESELWLMGIRTAAEQARTLEPVLFDEQTLEYVARTLEQERDYDPDCFRLYRVVQRIPSKSSSKGSSDDLSKVYWNVCYLAVGAHKVHLVPLPKSSNRASVGSMSELDIGMCFGVMTLMSISMHRGDDSFQLIFRAPFRPPFSVHLSSCFSNEIAAQIRQRAEFLRPEWVEQPFTFDVPQHVEDDIAPMMYMEEDHGCFDRTLIAYCSAYNVDTSNIRYTIDYACDDAPCFRLLQPASRGERRAYSALELLAVMRSLRYNESFVTISFKEINLDVLQNARDNYAIDFDALLTRSGSPVNIPGQEHLALLSQEIRALALKSKRLRRLDFTLCLTRTPMSGKGMHDPGCGIPEALFPLCRRQLTNVDWIVLNGIKLGDSDMDYFVDAASQKASHLRALEVSHCGISVHDLDLLLSTLMAQENTLEVINISGVQGRLTPELFQQQIGYFAHIRKINLSHISRTTGPEPLIAPETLLNWRLEELSLSHTAVNAQTVDSIAAYLSSPKSLTLRNLRLDQCGLTGEDVAVFLHSLVNDGGKPRAMHLHVSENRLHMNYSMLFNAIAKNKTPTHLTMRMVNFDKEDHFRQLVEALTKNTILKYLDISKASLPYDAGPETCKALQRMFEQNKTIEELDISGECAHLDVARFGIGLNLALTGLKKNTSLKVLKIEHQRLGLQGANTLASVLEENTSLQEVHCDNNEINLQSFTVLVNGLQRNKSVLYLPSMPRDREQSLDRVRREIESVGQENNHGGASTASTIRKTMKAAVGSNTTSPHKLSKSHRSPSLGPNRSSTFSSPLATSTPISASSTTPPHFMRHDVQVVLRSLNQKWDTEVQRLERYLYRNYNLASGVAVGDGDGVDGDVQSGDWDDAMSDGRPNTAASLGTFLSQLPVEQDDPAPVSAPAPDPPPAVVTALPPIEQQEKPLPISPVPVPVQVEVKEQSAPKSSKPRFYAAANSQNPNVSTAAAPKSKTNNNHSSTIQPKSSATTTPPTRPPLRSSISTPIAPTRDSLSVPTPPVPRVASLTAGTRKSIRSSKSNSSLSASASISSNSTTTTTKTTSGNKVAGRISGTASSLRGLLAVRSVERRGKSRERADGTYSPTPTAPRLEWELPEMKF